MPMAGAPDYEMEARRRMRHAAKELFKRRQGRLRHSEYTKGGRWISTESESSSSAVVMAAAVAAYFSLGTVIA